MPTNLAETLLSHAVHVGRAFGLNDVQTRAIQQGLMQSAVVVQDMLRHNAPSEPETHRNSPTVEYPSLGENYACRWNAY